MRIVRFVASAGRGPESHVFRLSPPSKKKSAGIEMVWLSRTMGGGASSNPRKIGGQIGIGFTFDARDGCRAEYFGAVIRNNNQAAVAEELRTAFQTIENFTDACRVRLRKTTRPIGRGDDGYRDRHGRNSLPVSMLLSYLSASTKA